MARRKDIQRKVSCVILRGNARGTWTQASKGWFYNFAQPYGLAATAESAKAPVALPEKLVFRRRAIASGALQGVSHRHVNARLHREGVYAYCVDRFYLDAPSSTMVAVRSIEPDSTFLVEVAVEPLQAN